MKEETIKKLLSILYSLYLWKYSLLSMLQHHSFYELIVTKAREKSWLVMSMFLNLKSIAHLNEY